MNEKQPTSAVALNYFISKIRNGELKPGQPLRESAIAVELGVSRSAVREALNIIVGWDIFEYTPFCGYHLRNFSLEDLLEWCEMREAIEPIAVRRLSRTRPPEVIAELHKCVDEFDAELNGECRQDVLATLDFKFHNTIVENCGSRSFNHMHYTGNCMAFYFAVSMSSGKIVFDGHVPLDGGKIFDIYKDGSNKSNRFAAYKHREILDYMEQGKEHEAEESCRAHNREPRWCIENILKNMNQQNKK